MGTAVDKPLKIAILAGGLTHERDISIRSGRRVAEEITDSGQIVKIIDVDSHLLENLLSFSPDVVWPLVHGTSGEDGTLQDLLDLVNFPYVGTQAGSSRVAFDKRTLKSILRKNGVKTPRGFALTQELFRQVGAAALLEIIAKKCDFPLVVKPNLGGSALGVSIVKNAEELPAAMVNAYSYAGEAVVEEYLSGTELGVSVVEAADGLVALPPVEIVTVEGPYDYDARYNPGRSEYFVPARLEKAVIENAANLAILVHKLLKLRDISRIDMIVDASGIPAVFDVNTAPGMTDTSLLPQAIKSQPNKLKEICTYLVHEAVKRFRNS